MLEFSNGYDFDLFEAKKSYDALWMKSNFANWTSWAK